MPARSLDELYDEKLLLILDAERQALDAYPFLVDAVQSRELRDAMRLHMEQTERQVERLEALVGDVTGDKRCIAMTALIEEAQATLGEIEDADTRDAFLIGAAQAIEHHEIASYGTACAWARELGRDEDLTELEAILAEEKETDVLLTELAEGRVNREAAAGEREVALDAADERAARQERGAARGDLRRERDMEDDAEAR